MTQPSESKENKTCSNEIMELTTPISKFLQKYNMDKWTTKKGEFISSKLESEEYSELGELGDLELKDLTKLDIKMNHAKKLIKKRDEVLLHIRSLKYEKVHEFQDNYYYIAVIDNKDKNNNISFKMVEQKNDKLILGTYNSNIVNNYQLFYIERNYQSGGKYHIKSHDKALTLEYNTSTLSIELNGDNYSHKTIGLLQSFFISVGKKIEFNKTTTFESQFYSYDDKLLNINNKNTFILIEFGDELAPHGTDNTKQQSKFFSLPFLEKGIKYAVEKVTKEESSKKN